MIHHLLVTLFLPFLSYAHSQSPPRPDDLELVLFEQFLSQNSSDNTNSLTQAMVLIANRHNLGWNAFQCCASYVYTERDCSVTIDDYTLLLHQAILLHYFQHSDKIIALHATGDPATHRFVAVLLSVMQWRTAPCIDDPPEKKSKMYWRHWREAFTEHASGGINTAEMLHYILAALSS